MKILHFNDVYDIEDRKSLLDSKNCMAGAARFVTAMREHNPSQDKLVFFCGDYFSPNYLSAELNGKQMVDVFNALNITCTCLGNHDTDYGLSVMAERIKECNSPWISANFLSKKTGLPILEPTMIVERFGVKIGLIGIACQSWLDLLIPEVVNECEIGDPIQYTKKYSKILREQGCQYIIALTHNEM